VFKALAVLWFTQDGQHQSGNKKKGCNDRPKMNCGAATENTGGFYDWNYKDF
jgi:hypothetical protein